MQEKAVKFEDALESLAQAKAILEDNYGVVDKRTTRVKRNISLIRLKLGMIPEALQEMKEVEELEQTLHGDRSVNIAKTYKVIGTLYMIDNPPKPQEAKEYLLRAQSIFEQRGLPKMLKEVKEKIKLINRQVKSGGPILG